jgi:hypothetical protein
MKGADPKSSGTEEERTRIVPIMVFVDPNCNQCIKLVEALHRKGFQCNVLDVYARASKKYLTWYGEAISRSIEEKGDYNPIPKFDGYDESYDHIDWDEVRPPFSHPVMLTPEGFYLYPDLFLDYDVRGSTVDEELLDRIMAILTSIWN